MVKLCHRDNLKNSSVKVNKIYKNNDENHIVNKILQTKNLLKQNRRKKIVAFVLVIKQIAFTAALLNKKLGIIQKYNFSLSHFNLSFIITF